MIPQLLLIPKRQYLVAVKLETMKIPKITMGGALKFHPASEVLANTGDEGISLKSPNVLPTNLSHNWPMVQDSSNSLQNSLSYTQGPVTDGGDEWSDPEENRTSPRKTKLRRSRRSADSGIAKMNSQHSNTSS